MASSMTEEDGTGTNSQVEELIDDDDSFITLPSEVSTRGYNILGRKYLLPNDVDIRSFPVLVSTFPMWIQSAPEIEKIEAR
jgi:hypothetical protein